MRRATVSLSEAASALGLSAQTLKAACRSGDLESVLVGGRKRLVTEAALGAWLGNPTVAQTVFDRIEAFEEARSMESDSEDGEEGP